MGWSGLAWGWLKAGYTITSHKHNITCWSGVKACYTGHLDGGSDDPVVHLGGRDFGVTWQAGRHTRTHVITEHRPTLHGVRSDDEVFDTVGKSNVQCTLAWDGEGWGGVKACYTISSHTHNITCHNIT